MSDPVFARPKKDAEFDPKRFLPSPLFESPEMKVVRATFRAGQFIPVHAPDVHVALYILAGEGEVVAGNERRKVTEGDLVVVPRKVRRGVKAKTDMIVLHVVSPSPTRADHGDMASMLARGEFELPA
jgi:quercetin dioxygenase-like cupin family protein